VKSKTYAYFPFAIFLGITIMLLPIISISNNGSPQSDTSGSESGFEAQGIELIYRKAQINGKGVNSEPLLANISITVLLLISSLIVGLGVYKYTKRKF
jgi:hypothetical protein